MGLEFYQEDLDKIRKYGFKPIAVTSMMFESTFVFETEKEAQDAYNQMEISNSGWDDEVQGWWYHREYFRDTLKEYKEKFKEEPKVYWLP